MATAKKKSDKTAAELDREKELAETPSEAQETLLEGKPRAGTKPGQRAAKGSKLEAAEAEVGLEEAPGVQAPKAGPKAKRAKQEKLEESEKPSNVAQAKTNKPPTRVLTPEEKLRRQHGKKYIEAAAKVEVGKLYELAEAVTLVKQTSPTKFDATVEMHFNLGVDPRQADQMVRASLVLPAGSGKSIRVAVLAPADRKSEADKAGADIFGEEAVGDLLQKEQIDFDVLIATPDMMAKLAKFAKILGPRGLMPNPKSGTVTNEVGRSVAESKAGRVEFRIDRQSIVHQAIGKISFTEEQLTANAKAMIDAILKAKPSGAKGTYVKAITLTSSMGPGIKLGVNPAIAAAHQ